VPVQCEEKFGDKACPFNNTLLELSRREKRLPTNGNDAEFIKENGSRRIV
jgi:hypothetical protein